MGTTISVQITAMLSFVNFRLGWMRRIMVNMIIESFRNKKLTTEFTDEFAEEQMNLSDEAPESEDLLSLDVLLKFVQQLPDRYRMVFNLYVLDGFSHEEIAGQLNISEGTSKSNLARAKKWLRQKVREYTNNETVRL